MSLVPLPPGYRWRYARWYSIWFPQRNLYDSILLLFTEGRSSESVVFRMLLDTLLKFPHLRGLTNALELRLPYDTLFHLQDRIGYMTRLSGVYHLFFLRGSTLFPRLRKLILEHPPMLHPSLPRIIRPLSSVVELELITLQHTSLFDTRTIITYVFPNVKHLHLDIQMVLDNGYVLPNPPNLPCRARNRNTGLSLRSLFLGHPKMEPRIYNVITKWLLGTPSISSIQAFRTTSELYASWPLIIGFGKTLQKLEILWLRYYETQDYISFESHKLPMLHVLYVLSITLPELPSFCNVISRGVSPTLSSLLIEVLVPPGGNAFDKRPWGVLDDTLSSSSFSNLKTIYLAVHPLNQPMTSNSRFFPQHADFDLNLVGTVLPKLKRETKLEPGIHFRNRDWY
ncbi:hypothetical protein ABKN59_007752 [Abortiporus biennis]